jgi:hypothetical protein
VTRRKAGSTAPFGGFLLGLLTKAAKPPPKAKVAVKGDKITWPLPPADPQWRQMTQLHQAIVGEQYRPEEIDAFAAGQDQVLQLVREPDNPNDANALAVWGAWQDRNGKFHAQLGYLPRELAAQIVATRPDDMPVQVHPVSLYRRGEYRDLKILILEPSAKSPFWRERGGAPAKLETALP